MNQLPTGPTVAMSPSPVLDIKRYSRLVLRWSWLIILCAVVAGAAAYFVSINTTPVYQATSRLMINEARTGGPANYSDILASERSARTYAELLQRGTTLRTALVQLGLDPDAAQIADQITAITVTPVRDTQLVNLTVEGTNPQLVAAVANALPQVFTTELRTVQTSRFNDSRASLESQLETLSREVEQTEIRLAELDGRSRTAQEEIEYGRLINALTQYQSSYANVLQSYETLRLAEIQSIDNIVVMEQATVPRVPVRPRVLVNTLLAVVVGSMLAFGTIFLIEYLDDRVRTPDDLRRIADIPTLGAIAKIPPRIESRAGMDGLVAVTEPRSPIVEAYRRLRTNLQFYNLDAGVQAIVVTSANMGEGKSTTAANLAVVLAQSGQTVILVDADLRKPTVHHRFDLPRKPGLSETLLAPTPVDLTRAIRDVPNLRVLTCGERVPNPSEVLSSKRMVNLIEELKTQANIVIFDSPPLLAVTDAEIVGRYTDGLLLVVDTEKTSGTAVHRALESVAQVNVPIMGALLNRISNSARGYYYYYSSSEYYYHSDDDDGTSDDNASDGGANDGKRAGPRRGPAHGGSATGDATLTPGLSYAVGKSSPGDQPLGD